MIGKIIKLEIEVEGKNCNLPFGEWKYLDAPITGPALMSRAVSRIEESIILVGGCQYGLPNYYSDKILNYEPKTRVYTQLKSLPSGRYNAQAEELSDGKALIFGGYDGSNYLNDCLIYNKADNTLHPADNIPFAVQSHASVKLKDGRIVFFGGSNAGGLLNKTCCYIEKENKWIELCDMPISLFYPSACLMKDGNVFICGGKNNLGHSEKCFIYNPELDVFSEATNAPYRMRGGFVESLDDGTIIYGCGELEDGTYNSFVMHYYPEHNRWLSIKELPDIRGFADSVKTKGGEIIVFGGNTADGKTQHETGFTRKKTDSTAMHE